MTPELTPRGSIPYSEVRAYMDNENREGSPSRENNERNTNSRDRRAGDRSRERRDDGRDTRRDTDYDRREGNPQEQRRDDRDRDQGPSRQQQAERGRPLVSGGSGDGYFENFPVGDFQGTALEDLARRIKEAGENSQIEISLITDVMAQAIERHSQAQVGDEKFQEFNEVINRISVQRDKDLRERQQSGAARQESQENVLQGERAGWDEFPAQRFTGTPLEALARTIEQAGLNARGGMVPAETVRQWRGEVARLSRQGGIDEAVQQEFMDAFITRAQGTERIVSGAEEISKGRNGERLSNTPTSIQEVCRWIVQNEGDEWGENGSNPLLKKEMRGDKEVEVFQKHNFVKWARERMMFYHDEDSENPQVNILATVGIETDLRRIGIVDMTRNRKKYFRDEIDNTVHTELSDEILNEVYLFQTSRNHDVAYRQVMGTEQVFKVLEQIHLKNDFTKGGQMAAIFSLAGNYGEVDEKTGERDTRVGDSIRKSYEIYYHISDFEELKRVLGEQGKEFFTRKHFENALRLVRNEPADAPIPTEYAELFNKLFYENGEARPGAFMNYINIFNESGKAESAINLTREAIRLVVSDIYGLENGLDKEGDTRKNVRNNLKYAETWAHTMTRWTGAGARNDTSGIGYDAFTKLQRFQQYRIRQSNSGRGGAFGNEYDVPVFKSLALDFLNGIHVEPKEGAGEDLTPFEIMREVDAIDRSDLSDADKAREKRLILEKMRFRQMTQLDYAANHLLRAQKTFDRLMGAQELNLDEFIKWEPYRGWVLDRGKFEEDVKENFIKPIRYGFYTYRNIDYTKSVRVRDVAASQALERPVYKNVTQAEAMFGSEVLESFYRKDKFGRIIRNEQGDPKLDMEFLGSDDGRKKLYKNAVRATLAAHIRSHRERNNGYSWIDRTGIEKFMTALKSMREIDFVEENEKQEWMKTSSFFTKEDLDWIRKKSGTGKTKLFLTDVVAKDWGIAGAHGAWEGWKEFWEGVFKDVA